MKTLVKLPILVLFSLLATLTILFVAPKPVAAASDCEAGSILGIPVWYKYLDVFMSPAPDCELNITSDNDPDTVGVDERGSTLISNSIPWLIAAAVIEILIRIATYVAVVFVFWGGYQIITSGGTPESVNKGRGKIMSGIIGFLLALMAATIVAFLAKELLAQTDDPTTGLPLVDADGRGVINVVLSLAYRIATGLSVIFVALSGFNFVTSGGDSQKVAKARQSIIFAVIGLAVVLLSLTIISAVGGRI